MKKNILTKQNTMRIVAFFIICLFSMQVVKAQCPLGSSTGTEYATTSTGGYTASLSGNGVGSPDLAGMDAYQTPTGAVFGYAKPFTGGAVVTVRAKYMSSSRLQPFNLDVSTDGVTWTTAKANISLTGTSETTYQNAVFTIPTSKTGQYKYIRLEGTGADAYWNVDAVQVAYTNCKQFVANSYFDNGIGGGTASDCTKNGGELSVGSNSGLKYNFIQGGNVIQSFAASDTISNLPNGTYTMIITKGATDVTPNLLPYTCSNNSKTITITNGVATPLPVAFCVFAKDSDGDGVPDNVDLDDDNDGILDTVEDACTPAVIISF